MGKSIHTAAVILRAAMAAVLLAATVVPPAAAADFDYPFACNPASLTADFAQRDTLPESDTASAAWYQPNGGSDLNGGWGPAAETLPPVAVPAYAGCESTTWNQERIVSAALHYVNEPDNPQGLQYRHHHIPGWDPQTSTEPTTGGRSDEHDGASPDTWGPGRGLDCSNFTAWVYNYGLGIKFSGSVVKQYAGTAGPMGQHLPADGPFQPGDLLYLHPDGDTTRPSHVVIYIDDNHIIDSRLNAQGLAGVQVRQREGWYRTAVLSGWRPTST